MLSVSKYRKEFRNSIYKFYCKFIFNLYACKLNVSTNMFYSVLKKRDKCRKTRLYANLLFKKTIQDMKMSFLKRLFNTIIENGAV